VHEIELQDRAHGYFVSQEEDKLSRQDNQKAEKGNCQIEEADCESQKIRSRDS
jgi:hypothetical protein